VGKRRRESHAPGVECLDARDGNTRAASDKVEITVGVSLSLQRWIWQAQVRGRRDMAEQAVLKLPTKAVQALRQHHTRQAAERLAAGEKWQEHDLVFCREDGTPLNRWHVPKEFQKITRAARLGAAWTPRELRHSFVSILSAHDVRLEDISDLVGHSCTAVTETVYRHEIRPALTKGATAMNRILKAKAAQSA
jgi:site-specific recombinase XerD